ncbi:leader peptidase (prepilin peptidase)/N-methyltransferase [Friedmanniella endophytica]|uniref:Leader peptidase (Prepilin peptidase)/N-methyltransferase n=1 Tax=Microlunatus kandeliicorticis TaxID=1759536 RepID=A0A7W3P5X7_9ACTN|nr:prepilin peptidase [Microlunatus kandeliicorticis]MBA8794368.1 leader peptidase (prepilin peptidase)/N-methyltransferase [Microlunatus kandeliicorticis]
MSPTGAAPGVLLAAVTVVALVVLLLLLGAPAVLRRLPEVEPGSPGHDPAKPPYRGLGTRRRRTWWAVAGGVAAVLVTLTADPPQWPAWTVLATGGVLLAGIDAASTWVPWRLTWSTGIAVAAGGLLGLALGSGADAWWRLCAGAGIGFGWYLLIHLLSRRRIGVGDVWLAALVSGPAAATGWLALYLCLLLGAVVGGLHGAVLLARGHRGPFAYGPSIVAGAFLALPVSALVGG